MPEPRVALVTGAAGDLGGAIARRLARDGFGLVVADRTPPQALAEELDALAIGGDLADAGAVERLAGGLDRCDVLVNNAADLGGGRLGELELATWRRVQAVNVEAPLLLCRALVPAMVQRGWGRIVNVVSNTFHRPPGAGMLAYVASKGALVGFTRAQAVELGATRVTVNAVAPGLTSTRAARRDLPAAAFERVRAEQALPRTLEAEDYGGPVAFLASDEAATMTGQTLCPDGGLVLL
jgi:3-oxoacyl-[acyl-carrier protein] reductase